MVEEITSKYLKQAREENGQFIISHEAVIKKTEDTVISGQDLLNSIEVYASRLSANTEEYNALGDQIDKDQEEHDILRDLAIAAKLISEDEDDEEELVEE